MLTAKEQKYLLEQYKKYNIPVYYWSNVTDVSKHDSADNMLDASDIGMAIASELDDRLL